MKPKAAELADVNRPGFLGASINPRAIQLIAAKRQDQISSSLANHDYQINVKAERLLEENTDITRAIKELAELIHEHIVSTTS